MSETHTDTADHAEKDRTGQTSGVRRVTGARLWRPLSDTVTAHAWLVIAIWLGLAGALNIVVPQLEHVVAERSGPFLPDASPSLITLSRMGEAFGESSATSIGYLVFEDTHGLTDADRRYVENLLGTIGANHTDIDSVQNLASDPATAHISVSTDGQANYAVVRFRGGMGSAEARRGQSFTTATVDELHPPHGLRVRLTGPAPAVGDELATEDRIVLLITGISVVMIVVLLLIVYRSVRTIVVPLATVGLTLAMARPLVAFLGVYAGLDVSIFTVMLLAALILGGGTDYAIFLLNGVHDLLRSGKPWRDAIGLTMERTGPVILASALTVAASCAVMAFTQVVLFRTAGLACSLGMLVAVAAALTLAPALMAVFARRGQLRPRPRGKSEARWRRLGEFVTTRPAATLAASVTILVLLALQVPRMTTGYDERAMQPVTTTSNQGYAAVARHFDANELTPDYVVINADHDLRTPADFSALNAAARAAGNAPGVKLVRSVTQPAGSVVVEFTLAGQNRLLAQRLGDAVNALRARLPQLDQLRDGASHLRDGMTRLDTGAGAISHGAARVNGGSQQLHAGLNTASTSSAQIADGADRLASGAKELADGIDTTAAPLFELLNTVSAPGPCPDGTCDDAGLKALAADRTLLGQIRYQLTHLKTGSRQLADGNATLATGAHQLRDGLSSAVDGSGALSVGQSVLNTKLAELAAGTQSARAGSEALTAGVSQVVPQMQQLVDGLSQAQSVLADSGQASGLDAGFHIVPAVFSDARFSPALRYFVSSDGRSARLMVISHESSYSPGAEQRVRALTAAVQQSLADTPLRSAEVRATGLAAGFADLHDFVMRDFALIATCTMLFVAVILALLVRSLIAPLYILGTIALSFAAALGLTVLIWQDIFGIDVYWAVPSLAFVALVSVGSDYNILVMSRIRDETTGDTRAGIVAAMATTGGVVSTAGVIFAVTMLAMLASPTHSIGQVGFAIGAGLLLDTFIVRALTVPAIAALLGRFNWWPARRGAQ